MAANYENKTFEEHLNFYVARVGSHCCKNIIITIENPQNIAFDHSAAHPKLLFLPHACAMYAM